MSAEVDTTEMDNANFCIRLYALAEQFGCTITKLDWDNHIIQFDGPKGFEHALAVALGDWCERGR